MKPKSETKFCEQWLDLSRHGSWTWLQRKKGDHFRASCTLCRTDFDIKNMGICAIISHEKGKKHQLALSSSVGNNKSGQQQLRWPTAPPSVTTLQSMTAAQTIDKARDPAQDTDNAGDSTAVSTSTSLQAESANKDIIIKSTDEKPTSTASTRKNLNLVNFFINDEVTRAEILWALNGVMCHTSLRGNANSASLFAQMFPDSEIASRFGMQKDKNSYVVTYGLGPYFQNQLSSIVQKCPFFAISFDESLNKISQLGQMDIVVRFWNDEKNQADTRFLTSVFLGHATSDDLLHAFTSALSQHNLNIKRMLQVSMDGPNVNLKFLRELKTYLKNESDPNDPELIDIGTCSLHVVHGAYKTAHNRCGWKLQIFLRSLYYLFKDFPSRRTDYTNASKSSLFPLRFCSIRWVENSSVIKRAMEIIPFVKLYVAAVEKKPPQSQNYVNVKMALQDKMLIAKLGFLQSVALQLEPFLTKYQSNSSLLPFMYSDVYNLLHSFMVRFIRAEIMTGVKSATTLMAVDLQKKENIAILHRLDIGFAATSACKGLSGTEVLQFREECCTYLQHVCMKLIEKCPLKYRLVVGASCLDPRVMLNETLSKSRVTTALEVFIEKHQMDPSVADIVKREYLELCKKSTVRSMLESFQEGRENLGEFLPRCLDLGNQHASFQTFVRQILTMFHGNAAVERSFSLNKECLVENLLNDSLVAQRVVYDAVSSAGGVAAVPITKALIHAVRNASTRRKEAAKKKKENEDAAANHHKRALEEMKLLEAKKAKIAQSARDETEALNHQLKHIRETLKK